MSQTLDANLNVISEDETIEIQLLDGDLNIIQKLDDEPNDVGGLTAQELKAKFDESGNIIKKYINETLVPAVLEDDATEKARKAAENERADNEKERVSNENARVEAEEKRASDFTTMQNDNEDALKAVEGAAALLEAMRVFAETLNPGSSATVKLVKNEETGGYDITFGLPEGQRGEPGNGNMNTSDYDPQEKKTDIFKYVDDALEGFEPGSSVYHFFITIPTTGWTENSDTGVQSISIAVEGVTVDMNGNASPYYNGDKSADSYAAFVEAKNQFLDYITNGDAETYDGGVTFNVYGDVPTVEIPVMVEVS